MRLPIAALLTPAVAAALPAAGAEGYPNRVSHVGVPFAPAGTTDGVAAPRRLEVCEADVAKQHLKLE